MHCKHCGFVNGEDDHRCLRCGRRLRGTVVAAPPGYSGANALAPELIAVETGAFAAPQTGSFSATATGEQPTLFPSSAPAAPNVIPFDRLQRREATGRTSARPQTAPTPTVQVRVRRASTSSAPNTQASLDFLPGTSTKSRKLKTQVEAQVFCDQPVATPMHRVVAAAIDAALIMIGFGLLVLTFNLLGGSIGSGKMLWIGLGATLALVTMFYGVIWAIAGRETAGMRFTDLQLITFDGFPLDARSRALRFASAWLSFCSGGLGLLWAIADEENLTWHDHISKTFPTIREVPRSFVKQRR